MTGLEYVASYQYRMPGIHRLAGYDPTLLRRFEANAVDRLFRNLRWGEEWVECTHLSDEIDVFVDVELGVSAKLKTKEEQLYNVGLCREVL